MPRSVRSTHELCTLKSESGGDVVVVGQPGGVLVAGRPGAVEAVILRFLEVTAVDGPAAPTKGLLVESIAVRGRCRAQHRRMA